MRLFLFLLGTVLPLNALAVTINIDADSLKDASGNPMTSGVIVLVADVKDLTGSAGRVVRNGFSGPTDAKFEGNDFLVHRWNFSSGSPEYFGPGAFQASIHLKLSGSWQAGDPLRLYWFPENTAADAGPGAGKHFGTYRGAGEEPAAPNSFAWITPAESAILTINGETASVPKESTISLSFLTSDANALAPAGIGSSGPLAGVAANRMVTGRFIFYNNSSWDGNSSTANASDDDAIAADKAPVFSGSTANLANYTSYTRGINGIMVDILNPANAGAVSASDFSFKAGNDNNPAGWTDAPAPSSITRRAGAGVAGADRYTIIWPDNALQKQWLQVTVLASANTGLGATEVFYFGNAVGESGFGNGGTTAAVNLSDEIGARNNLNPFGPVPIDNVFDYNRDKKVNLSDEISARLNISVLSPLRLITIP
jgi:hypothetical protein